MARGPCHDVLALVPQKDAEASTVADARRAGIELVQSVLEKLDIRGRGLFDLEAMHLTPIVCLTHYEFRRRRAMSWSTANGPGPPKTRVASAARYSRYVSYQGGPN